ncbi:putative guanylate-binding protein [Plasmopara halstedii]
MGKLLFSGQLLAVTVDETNIAGLQIKKEALDFLQRLPEPLLVVSVHGRGNCGKTALIQSLLGLEKATDTEGVWLYVHHANYTNAKYLVVLDRPDFGEDKKLDTLTYTILAGLSSVVVHHIDGPLTSDAVSQFALFAPNVESDTPPAYGFPQKPKLLWVLQNVSAGELKEQIQKSELSLQEMEQTYLCNALATLPDGSPYAQATKFYETAFSDQKCFTMPQIGIELFKKRLEKLMRVLTDSIQNRYSNGVILTGPLLGSIIVSMMAHSDNVYKTFKGPIWKNLIYNCCYSMIGNGVKLYKLRMFESLGSIVDTSDLMEFQPASSAVQNNQPSIELPYENDVMIEIHNRAKREAKAHLRLLPYQAVTRSNVYQEKNNRISLEHCQLVLKTLHRSMTEKVVAHLNSGEGYSFQSTEVKRFYHHYQTYLFDLIGQYADQGLGPAKNAELAKFMHKTIQPQLADFSISLDKLRQQDTKTIEKMIEEKKKEAENFNTRQRMFQKENSDAQGDVKRQLVNVAKLQALRKDALAGAIVDLTEMHSMAIKQKELLEEAAFASVQLPEQKVIEAAQEKEVTELQGYLIKQGGGGNVLNPLRRKNWKQRYFILTGSNLIYAKSKDDYERGKIIKELCLTGCKIDPSRDAGEGFDITPGKSAHVFELQRGLFEKNSKKRSSAADSGRIFKLRTQTIQERDMWMEKLRQAAGGY